MSMSRDHANIIAANEFKEVEQDNITLIAGYLAPTTPVDEDIDTGKDDASCHERIMVVGGHNQKLSVPLCSHYLQKGFCAFGMDCKFEHSTKEDTQGLDYTIASEDVGQIECKFNLLPGGCKNGNDCRFRHDAQLNFLGLPIRPSEKKCPFYMRTGGCKYASKCMFHHPEPMAVIGEDSFQDHTSEGRLQHCGATKNSYETPWTSENTSNEGTDFLGLSSYNPPSPFASNYGLQSNEPWNDHQTAAPPLHFREININDQHKYLSSNDTAHEFGGATISRQFKECPQRPGEPECQHFIKTGYCKFKSVCRYHHPIGLPLKPINSNYENGCSIEQIPPMPLFSANISNKQKAFIGPPSSYVPGNFKPKAFIGSPSSFVPGNFMPPAQGFQPNMQWNEYQTATTSSHRREFNLNYQQNYISNQESAYKSSLPVESQQFDEYPQRPNEPECMHFMKTGYCKFKLACRYHHPNGLPQKFMRSNFQGFQPNIQLNGNQMARNPLHTSGIYINEQEQESTSKNFSLEFSDVVESQQFHEYPQRPSEPECQYFMKTGYCKFNLSCRFHHPNCNLSQPKRQTLKCNVLDDAAEHLCGTPLLLENTSTEKKIILGHPSYNKMLQPNVQLGNDQLDEHLQRPCKPECQHSVKCESCRLNSACRNHHPKSDLGFLGMLLRPVRNKSEQNSSEELCDTSLPSANTLNEHVLQSDVQLNGNLDKPLCTYYSRYGICNFGPTCRFSHHMEHSS